MAPFRGDGLVLQAAPLVPVAFPGDLDIAAHDVIGPSEDFNLMVRATLPRAEVHVATGDVQGGGLLALYAVEAATVSGVAMQRGDVILTEGGAVVSEGPVLAARILGLSDAEKRLRKPGQ
jgi:environmental stress-induced protein Ves